MERIIFKPKLKRFLDLDTGIYYVKNNGSIYFLKSTKNLSINYLRKFVNYEEKKPDFFYNIIHANYLMQKKASENSEKAKKPYYAKMRISRAKVRIEKLKEQIINEEKDLKVLEQ